MNNSNKVTYSIKQVIYYIIGIVGIAAFAALQMKINIGIGPWDGLGRSVSYLTGLKVGDVSILQSLSCVLLQLALQRKDFKIVNILSLGVGFIMGKLINLFYYNIFSNLVVDNYILYLVIFIISVIVIAFFVSMIQTSNMFNLPLEGLCQAVVEKTDFKFSTVRQAVDIICVVTIIVMTVFLKIPLTLREGTIISMILFGPAMGIFMPPLYKFVRTHAIV